MARSRATRMGAPLAVAGRGPAAEARVPEKETRHGSGEIEKADPHGVGCARADAHGRLLRAGSVQRSEEERGRAAGPRQATYARGDARDRAVGLARSEGDAEAHR